MERIVLRAGEVAARAGVHRETLRYYERRGLIPPPPRRISGYRAYPAETVERVRLIKWAQGLGFTLREIVELSRIPRDHVRRRTRHVRSHASAKIAEIDKKIRRLAIVKRELLAITGCRCNGDCPIVRKAATSERREDR
ncbi:MAG TPA: MerR family transcriptional regulator [Methylomirabilota bacterium]